AFIRRGIMRASCFSALWIAWSSVIRISCRSGDSFFDEEALARALLFDAMTIVLRYEWTDWSMWTGDALPVLADSIGGAHRSGCRGNAYIPHGVAGIRQLSRPGLFLPRPRISSSSALSSA